MLLLVLEVVSHPLLVQLHEKRHLLLPLCSLKVIHRLGQAAELARLFLSLLDLFLDGLLPELDLVHLLTLLELLSADSGRFHERPGLLHLLVLHLPADPLLLPLRAFDLESLLLLLGPHLLELQLPCLLLLLLLLEHLLVLLLPALDDDLPGQDALVLSLDLGFHLLNGLDLPVLLELVQGALVDQGAHLVQALGEKGEVGLDLVALKGVRAAQDNLVPVVNPDLEVGVPHGVHQEPLHLAKLEKDHPLRDEVQSHRGVDLGDLVDHLERAHVLELANKLLKVDLLHRAGGAHDRFPLLLLQTRQDALGLLAQVQRTKVALEERKELLSLWHCHGNDPLCLEL